MTTLLHDLLLRSAERDPTATALMFKQDQLDYESLASLTRQVAHGILSLGLQRQERVAVYLPKRPEAVTAMFATTAAGGVFVPINPLLKAPQVAHILKDSGATIMFTSKDRLPQLETELSDCADLRHIVVIGANDTDDAMLAQVRLSTWDSLLAEGTAGRNQRVIDQDMASIFYTSGSTGKPKGVVLSHRNMIAGAASVAEYLRAAQEDRLLAVLPFSFDYGFSQLSISFQCGSAVALIDYLFPKDVITALEKYSITGLAGVPPLWVQLAKLEWPEAVRERLTYITNSGGAMPRATLDQLRHHLPKTRVFLMYGLTEAFRSTYLEPEEIDARPDSIGKAIPNAEVMVLDAAGKPCAPGEPGELVHRGALVSLGYWNDPEKTAHRFRPAPNQDPGIVLTEMAVWSGDTVRMDEDGYLYFVGRRDDMIKTSGYRVSPSEVEDAVYDSGFVAEAIAFGIPHPELGQAIVVVAVAANGQDQDEKRLIAALAKELPNYMVPARIVWRGDLPRNPNGKIDRKKVQAELTDLFDATKA